MKKLLKLVIFILLIIAFIYLGTRDYKSNDVTKKKDVEKIDSVIYLNESVFVKTNHSKILNKLSSKNDAIIYICIDGNKLCINYGNIINDIAKEYGIDTIYYYDIRKDRESNNATYQKIVSKLTPYLYTSDLGKQDLYSPTLIFFKKGEIISFDDDLAFIKGNKDVKEIFNDELINLKTEYLSETMERFINNE